MPLFAGIGGSGRQSAARLAAFMADFELFQIEITKNYSFSDWRDDLRKMLRRAGEEGVSMVSEGGKMEVSMVRWGGEEVVPMMSGGGEEVVFMLNGRGEEGEFGG